MSRLLKVSDIFSPLPILSAQKCMFGNWFGIDGKAILAESLSDQAVEERWTPKIGQSCKVVGTTLMEGPRI
jgi:hypothetical protein